MPRLRRSSTSDGSGNGTSNGTGKPGGRRHRQGVPPTSRVLEDLLARAGFGPGLGGGAGSSHHTSGAGGRGPVRLVISMGKGGTGKTTVAASLAVRLAAGGLRVLVASIDPAHNLGDVLDRPLGPKPAPIPGVEGLWALEVDTRRELESYLDRMADQVKGTYRYLQVLNLDGYLETLRYSPGVEEHAVLEAVGRLLKLAENRGFDALILDTPPTGLTIRVLSLPTVSVRWAEQLLRVRQAILERRAAVQRLTGPQEAVLGGESIRLPADRGDDPITRVIHQYLDQSRELRDLMGNPARCAAVLVRNPDRLSALETERALADLATFGIPVGLLVINKVEPDEVAPEMASPGAKVALQAAWALDAAASSPLPFPIRAVPLQRPEPFGPTALLALSGWLMDAGRPVGAGPAERAPGGKPAAEGPAAEEPAAQEPLEAAVRREDAP